MTVLALSRGALTAGAWPLAWQAGVNTQGTPVDVGARLRGSGGGGSGANFRNQQNVTLENITRLMRRELHSKFRAPFCL